ncbi:hypothetical protein AB1K54_01275 [Microbacterium sp. BWT-B31]|uniref:hypothetical protein n=1 Tax=Microbacterium sp. BWT-B31 TaxID=3232072 RepID=UPI003527B4CF
MIDLLRDSFLEVGFLQAAIVTIATIVTIGVAFLARPGIGTLYWTIAFTLILLATFGLIAGRLIESDQARHASMGVLFSGAAFLWSGFRIMWRRHPFISVSVAFLVVSTVALMLSDETSFPFLYRTVFLLSSLFAAFFVLDWTRRRPTRREACAIPLVVASIVFFGLGVQGYVTALLPGTTPADLELQQVIASITLGVYVICAVIAAVGFTLRDSPLAHRTIVAHEWQQFERAAAARVAEAESAGDPVSVVCLRLDDDDELRQLTGDEALSELLGLFRSTAVAGFAADPLVGSPRLGTIVVVTAQPDSTMRAAVGKTLARVPAVGTRFSPLIHTTASAGWASAAAVGYDLRTLVAAATGAAEHARASGGDAWESVGVERVDTGVIPLSRW